MSTTYLTTEELAERIKFDPRYIRESLKDRVLVEGRHYIRPFGRRKILFLWEAIETDMRKSAAVGELAIPLATGGVAGG